MWCVLLNHNLTSIHNVDTALLRLYYTVTAERGGRLIANGAF